MLHGVKLDKTSQLNNPLFSILSSTSQPAKALGLKLGR